MPTVCPGDREIPEGRCLSYPPVPLGLTPPTEGIAHGLDFTLLCDLGQVIQPLWSGFFSSMKSVRITPTSWPCFKKEMIREERGRPAAWVTRQQTPRGGREGLRRSHRPQAQTAGTCGGHEECSLSLSPPGILCSPESSKMSASQTRQKACQTTGMRGTDLLFPLVQGSTRNQRSAGEGGD